MLQSSKLDRLATERIGPLLWSLSCPAIIATLVNALYNVIDRLYIGQGCGHEAIAGLALTFPVMTILVAFGTLIGVGSSALLSIRLGEHDRVATEKVLGQCIALKILAGIVFPALLYWKLDWVLVWMGGTQESIPYARDYLRVVLFGSGFAHLSFGLSSMMRAEGSAKESMCCMLVGAGMNIVLDPLFIFVLGMGVKGAAWATNISMVIAACYALSHYMTRRSMVRLRLRRIWIYPALAKQAFAIGLSPFLIQTMSCIVNVCFNVMFRKWSPDSTAATLSIASMGIVNTLIFLFLMPIFGMTQGLQPIVGYNYGARNFHRVREALALGLKIAVATGVLTTVVSIFFAQLIVRCFTTDATLISVCTGNLRLANSMFWLIGVNIVMVSYYQSIGRSSMAIFLSLSRQALVFVPCILLLPYLFGVQGIWLAIPVSDVLAFLMALPVAIMALRMLRAARGNALA